MTKVLAPSDPETLAANMVGQLRYITHRNRVMEAFFVLRELVEPVEHELQDEVWRKYFQ